MAREAACCVGVQSWEEPAPPFEPEGEIAKKHRGVCVRCHADIEAERTKLQDEGGDVVPLRSFRNRMDPYWNFPRKQFEELFRSMTVPESMLVALDWMQVNVCTVRRTRMDVFKKNVISFPQDTAKFFAMMGAMKQFRVQDRVHSNRPPGSDPLNVNRAPMLWNDAV